MKLITKVAAIALLLLALAPAVAAGAQTCTDDPAYCESVSNDGAGADTEVAPAENESVTGGGAGENENVVRGGSADTGAGAATAPSGTLPFTGGDVVGVAIIGAAAVALGALLVRRSKAGHGAA